MATINSHLESASCQATRAQQEVANTVLPSANKDIRFTAKTPQLPVKLGQPTVPLSQRKHQAATDAPVNQCSNAGLQSNDVKPANGTGQDISAMFCSQPKQERQAEACLVPPMPQPSPDSPYQLVPHAALPGEYCVPDFVTKQEELDLLHMLDACSPLWQDKTFNGKHRCGCSVDCMMSGILHLACCFYDGVICSTLDEIQFRFCSNLLTKHQT